MPPSRSRQRPRSPTRRETMLGLLDEIRKLDKIYLEQADLDILSIRVEQNFIVDDRQRELNSRARFFTPMEHAYYHQYPINEAEVQEERQHQRHFLELREYDLDLASRSPETLDVHQRIQIDPNNCAHGLLGYLFDLIDGAPRDLPNNKSSMASLTCWHQVQDPDSLFANTRSLHGIKFTSEFVLQDRDKAIPHIVVCAIQDAIGDDSKLLYGEVAPIIRLISRRHEQPEFYRRHKVMPVLMVSLMGPQHARIIHAHQDEDKKLLIRYSRLYSFEKLDQAQAELFVRWILSTPVGDTRLRH